MNFFLANKSDETDNQNKAKKMRWKSNKNFKCRWRDFPGFDFPFVLTKLTFPHLNSSLLLMCFFLNLPWWFICPFSSSPLLLCTYYVHPHVCIFLMYIHQWNYSNRNAITPSDLSPFTFIRHHHHQAGVFLCFCYEILTFLAANF